MLKRGLLTSQHNALSQHHVSSSLAFHLFYDTIFCPFSVVNLPITIKKEQDYIIKFIVYIYSNAESICFVLNVVCTVRDVSSSSSSADEEVNFVNEKILMKITRRRLNFYKPQ